MPKRPPIYVHPSKRLRAMGARRLASEVKREQGDSARLNAHQRGYDRTWARLRRLHLADNPWCVRCLGEGRVTQAIDVDHVEPIAIAPDRRLDPTNLQSLCKPHHGGAKQREDIARYGRAALGLWPWRRGRRGQVVNHSDPSQDETD